MGWTQATVPDTAWGAHPEVSANPQSGNFISLCKRKEVVDKATYTSLPLHNHNLQRTSIKNKGNEHNSSNASPVTIPL